jgi:hypothetical protein
MLYQQRVVVGVGWVICVKNLAYSIAFAIAMAVDLDLNTDNQRTPDSETLKITMELRRRRQRWRPQKVGILTLISCSSRGARRLRLVKVLIGGSRRAGGGKMAVVKRIVTAMVTSNGPWG